MPLEITRRVGDLRPAPPPTEPVHYEATVTLSDGRQLCLKGRPVTYYLDGLSLSAEIVGVGGTFVAFSPAGAQLFAGAIRTYIEEFIAHIRQTETVVEGAPL